MTGIGPTSDNEILFRAGKVLGRIQTQGPRALSGIAFDEIEALALALLILGLKPLCTGQHLPSVNQPRKGCKQ